MSLTPKDPDEKVRRGYTEPESIVWADGREKLVGKDWRKRKEQLRKRSGGRCERYGVLGRSHDAFCYGEGEEPHHIKKRWPLRDDRLENLADLSHACHSAEDPRKVRWTKKERRQTEVTR